jgi:D-glycero-alpha-D-manno-heptose-7-phosphate kinase
LDGVQITFGGRQAFSRFSGEEGVETGSGLGLLHAIARYFDMADGQRVFVASQVPVGIGDMLLGSLAVSMIKVLAFRCGLDLEPRAVAELTCQIKESELGLRMGRHAAYAAAHGGICSIAFSSEDVTVEALRIPAETRRSLEDGLMLFAIDDSGSPREARSGAQADADGEPRVQRLSEIASRMRAELEDGNLDAFGQLLHSHWLEMGALNQLIPSVERAYDAALDAGALGGIMTGEGGSGFLVLYCQPERQAAVMEALSERGLQRWPMVLDSHGVYAMQAIPWSRPEVMSAAPWMQPLSTEHTPSVAKGSSLSPEGVARH